MATNGGSGGNTTTAEAARKFYSTPELRQRLVDLCPPKYKFMYEQILFHSKYLLQILDPPSCPDKTSGLCS